MLSNRLRHRQDAAAGSQPDPRSRPSAGQRRQLLVQLGQPLDRNQAVTSRQGIKRRVEFDPEIEPTSDATQPDDLGPDRKSSQELRALHRLGLLRQRSHAAVYATFPVNDRSQDMPLNQPPKAPNGNPKNPPPLLAGE